MRDNFKNNTAVLLFILMLFLIERPVFVDYVLGAGLIRSALTGLKYAAYAFIFVKWLNNRRVSSALVLALMFYGLLIASTLYNGGSVMDAVKAYMGYIFMVMLMDNESDDPDDLWQACIIYLSVMIALDCITSLIFPTGMFTTGYTYQGQVVSGLINWFFTGQNYLGRYIICALFFKGEYDLRKKEKLSYSFYLLSVLSVIALIIRENLTFLVAALLMIVILVCAPFIKNSKPGFFTSYVIVGAVALMNVGFVLLNRVGSISGFFITDILGGSITFSGRTTVWQRAIERILEQPVLGYGYVNSEDFADIMGIQITHSHNYYLHTGMNGGFIAIALLVVIIILMARHIRKQQYEFTGIAMSAYLFAFLVGMSFEIPRGEIFWIILAYAFYIKDNKQPESVADKQSDLLGWSINV